MEYLLEFCQTPEQENKVKAVIACGSMRAAGRKLGLSKNAVTNTIKALKARAAKHGVAPDEGLNHRTPHGFNVARTTTLYDADGNIKLEWVQNRAEKEHIEAIKEAAQVLSESFKGKSLKIKPPKFTNKNTLSVYPMGDPHIGAYAWSEETGTDVDCDLAALLYRDAAKFLMADATAEQALIINVGDFFHADNSQNMTTRSHNMLDVDTRYARVLRLGIAIMKNMIEEALEHHKTVKVINAIGNHDDHSAIFLKEVLAAFYSNNKRVTIDTSPAKFHYHQFGKVLLGVTHGDTVKPDRLGSIMTRDCLKIISQSRFRVWHTGHIHKDIVNDFNDCTTESHRTLFAGDAWAMNAGYRSWRSMKRIDYDKECGEFSRKTFSVQPESLMK